MEFWAVLIVAVAYGLISYAIVFLVELLIKLLTPSNWEKAKENLNKKNKK